MYDDFEDEEEEVFNEELEKWKEEHHHCINCFDLNCSKRDVCEMVRCKQCSIYMHSCKLEDHLYGVCPRVTFTKFKFILKCFRVQLSVHLLNMVATLKFIAIIWQHI